MERLPRTSRAEPRLRRRLKVTFLGGSSFTTDVGPGGFSTERVRVFPTGAPVEGAIHEGGAALPFRGRVAWCRPGDASLGLRGRMGVAFTWVAAPAALALGRPSRPPGSSLTAGPR